MKLKLKKKVKVVNKVKKDPEFKRLRVYSRHPSHSGLRNAGLRFKFRALIRLGSTTVADKPCKVELNSIQGVKNSSNKLLMKQCFTKSGIKTADWFIKYDSVGGKGWLRKDVPIGKGDMGLGDIVFPIICKSLYGSRGMGNSKIDSKEQFVAWMKGKDLSHYIFESYKTFSREYRIHVTALGAFYTCRKMLKKDTPDDKKFQRHDDNCVWYMEENPGFDKPVNWNKIVLDCQKALKELGLDIGAFDLKVQSSKDGKGKARPDPDYIIIESCSAPSFGDVTLQKYKEVIPLIIKHKLNDLEGV